MVGISGKQNKKLFANLLRSSVSKVEKAEAWF